MAFDDFDLFREFGIFGGRRNGLVDRPCRWLNNPLDRIANPVPLAEEWPRQDWFDDLHYFVAIGILGARFRSFIRVESHHEERAEDGRIDLAPIAGRCT